MCSTHIQQCAASRLTQNSLIPQELQEGCNTSAAAQTSTTGQNESCAMPGARFMVFIAHATGVAQSPVSPGCTLARCTMAGFRTL